MTLLVWIALGAACGFVWSRAMAHGSIADVAAGAAGGILGGLLVAVLGWSGRGGPGIGDAVGPIVLAFAGLAAWRVAIGRRV